MIEVMTSCVRRDGLTPHGIITYYVKDATKP